VGPTVANGKICYLELPARDLERSAAFYRQVFGWAMRRRGDGATAFDDTTGQVSGAFVTGRSVAAAAPGLLVYIMVDDAAATCGAIEAHGGVIVQPIGADAPEITARFADPAGNVLGLYQEPRAGS
jgi:predicted enzyme related to lactoylglutathione lyase